MKILNKCTGVAILSACLVGASFVAGGGALASASSLRPIKVGIMLPETGVNGTIGSYMTQGAVATVKMLNAKGGILGHKILIKNFDTQGDTQIGVNAFNSFLGEGYQFGLIGYTNVVEAVAPLASRHNVLLLDGGAPPTLPAELGTHMVSTLNGVSHEMACAGKYVKVQLPQVTSAGFIYANVGGYLEAAQMAAQAAGVTSVGYEPEAQGTTTDFTSILSTLLAKNPQLLYLYTYGPDPGTIIKQARGMGFTGTIMTYSGAAVPSTVSVAGSSAAEGAVATSGIFNSTNPGPTQRFISAWKKYIDPSVVPSTGLDFYHATMGDSILTLAAAMKYVAAHHGNMFNPQTVRAAFNKIGTIRGLVTGNSTYTSGNPIPAKPYEIVKVVNGNWTPSGTISC